MTLRNEYKQKTPMLREAEERALPIYVLKSNTVPQMQSSLTSIFSLEIDPREAAMRETEEAIGMVLNGSEPGRAVAAERLHPAAPAPDGRAGEPRLAVARPRAVPPGPALPGRRPAGLAMSAEATGAADPRTRRPASIPTTSSSTAPTTTSSSRSGRRPSAGPSRRINEQFVVLRAAREQRVGFDDPLPAGAGAQGREEPGPHRLRRGRHGGRGRPARRARRVRRRGAQPRRLPLDDRRRPGGQRVLRDDPLEGSPMSLARWTRPAHRGCRCSRRS